MSAPLPVRSPLHTEADCGLSPPLMSDPLLSLLHVSLSLSPNCQSCLCLFSLTAPTLVIHSPSSQEGSLLFISPTINKTGRS